MPSRFFHRQALGIVVSVIYWETCDISEIDQKELGVADRFFPQAALPFVIGQSFRSLRSTPVLAEAGTLHRV